MKTSSKSFCVCKELSTDSTGIKQATYIRYVLTNMVDTFVLKWPGTSFQVIFFTEFFDKKIFSSKIT